MPEFRILPLKSNPGFRPRTATSGGRSPRPPWTPLVPEADAPISLRLLRVPCARQTLAGPVKTRFAQTVDRSVSANVHLAPASAHGKSCHKGIKAYGHCKSRSICSFRIAPTRRSSTGGPEREGPPLSARGWHVCDTRQYNRLSTRYDRSVPCSRQGRPFLCILSLGRDIKKVWRGAGRSAREVGCGSLGSQVTYLL